AKDRQIWVAYFIFSHQFNDGVYVIYYNYQLPNNLVAAKLFLILIGNGLIDRIKKSSNWDQMATSRTRLRQLPRRQIIGLENSRPPVP
ncbi:MAG: hypothetical protein VCF08_23430, partial [Alphaproteobacteria bacterium]